MYSVIVFVNENAVEVVPKKWIISRDSSEKPSFWPPFKRKQLTNAVLDNIDADLSWTAHSCRIIKDGFDNILKTRNVAQRYTNSSDIESGGECRKKTATQFFIETSQSSDYQKKAHDLQERAWTFEPQKENNKPLSVALPPLPSTAQCLTSQNDVDLDGTKNDDLTQILAIVKAQYKKLCLISTRQRELLQRVQNLETMMQHHLAEKSPLEDENVIFKKIASDEDYQQLVEDVNNPTYRKGMISKLVVLGGDNPINMTVRAINFLLSNPMQRKFNRTGVRGKMNFSQVIEPIMKEAILQRFPDVNFSEVERKVSSYLSIAGDRDGGRKRRSCCEPTD